MLLFVVLALKFVGWVAFFLSSMHMHRCMVPGATFAQSASRQVAAQCNTGSMSTDCIFNCRLAGQLPACMCVRAFLRWQCVEARVELTLFSYSFS